MDKKDRRSQYSKKGNDKILWLESITYTLKIVLQIVEIQSLQLHWFKKLWLIHNLTFSISLLIDI